MKPLNGYVNVTKFHLPIPCEKEDCLKDGTIPTRYDNKKKEWTCWYCPEHAAPILIKNKL